MVKLPMAKLDQENNTIDIVPNILVISSLWIAPIKASGDWRLQDVQNKGAFLPELKHSQLGCRRKQNE
jgi:hypothetical protein